MEWGPGNSRFDYSDKVHFEKPIPLGDLIYLDRERCILCARCVRFQDEIAGDPVLGFDNRGRSWEIISKSDPPFDSKFSGNTTDICPVGALTSSDFRFKARVWELRSVPSICPHCPVGCDISLDMRYNDLMRVMPRENDYVNEIWTCDKGRYGMRYFGSAGPAQDPDDPPQQPVGAGDLGRGVAVHRRQADADPRLGRRRRAGRAGRRRSCRTRICTCSRSCSARCLARTTSTTATARSTSRPSSTTCRASSASARAPT